MTPSSSPTDDADAARNRPGAANLAALATWRPTWLRLAGAGASGLVLSTAFPPLEWGWTAWVAVIPMLLVPPSPTIPGRLGTGYLFGLAFFIPSLFWLNTIGFAAGILLALPCAIFPMVWYVCTISICAALNGDADTRSGPAFLPPARLQGAGRQSAAMLLTAAAWVALEWVRGWVFTGFPWNQVGISQWDRAGLLMLTTVTGVYGISFLVVAANVALAFTTVAWTDSIRRARPRPLPAALVLLVVLLLPSLWINLHAPAAPPPRQTLRVLAVQGNIPQCRQWTEESFREALEVYTGLTRLQAPATQPDLVIWPESAVPAPITYTPYWQALQTCLAETRTPILLGAIRYARVPAAPDGNDPPMAASFNSAMLLTPDGTVANRYDKTHLVPFGEYTPFEAYLPWLVDWIGMGRSLSPGSAFVVLDLPKDTRAGVNICFEDAFPGISRQFVLRGANVLMTITNDAWYATSAGARQHLLHAVFRAVENQRPLLRSGNNSDTCLITPRGGIRDHLSDPLTGTPFVRGTALYHVPVAEGRPLTFYTRHGDVFAGLCTVISAASAAILAGRQIRRKYDLLCHIRGTTRDP